MSATGRIAAQARTDMSRLRQFGANVAMGFRAVTRRPGPGAPRPAWPVRSRLLLGAVVAVLAVACAMLWLDAPSLANVRSLPWLVIVFFDNITDFGLSGWFLFPITFMLLVIAAIDRPSAPPLVRGTLAALAARLGFVFAAIAASGLFVAVIKRLVGRARPFVAGNETLVFQIPSWRPDYASLPSGHATTAFAAAVAIGAVWPRARAAMWIYAGLIAVSRIVVAAHHPSDVIAGAVVGTAGALLARHWFAARRLAFTVGPDGGVRARPAPSWRRIKSVAHRLFSA